MFKALIPTDTSVTANSNIPLNVVKNTSGDVTYNSTTKAVTFNRAGHYSIMFHIVGTDIAVGDITVSEVINGTISDTALSAGTSAATTDFVTLDVPDILTVYPTTVGTNATLSFQSDVACTATTGSLTIVRIGR